MPNPISRFFSYLKKSLFRRCGSHQCDKVLQSFFDSAPLLMGICQIEGNDIRHLSDNRSAHEFLGLAKDEMKGRLSSELGIPQALISEWIAHFRRAEYTACPQSFEYWHEGRQKRQYLSCTVSFIGKSDNTPSVFSYVVQDITHLKSIEEELRTVTLATEEKLHLALRSGCMGLWHYDLTTNQVTVSPELNEILGAENLEKGIEQVNKSFVHPEDKEEIDKAWKLAVETRVTYSKEYRIIKPSGEIRWLFSTGKAEYAEDGKPLSFSGVTLDITEKKKSEVALQEALKSRDEFISVASHELKTPLTSLKLQAELQNKLALKDSPDAFDKSKILASNDRSLKLIDRLSRLVDDMLDISRIRTGKLTIDKKVIDICVLVNETVEKIRSNYLEGNIGTITYICLQDRDVLVDPMRIEQVINNLLQNAIKYGRGKDITITCDIRDEWLVLKVKDQGIGIPKELQQKIFDRFERAVSKNEVSGLGLGLYISKQLVKAHGGNILVESEPGKGSTFIVELPLLSDNGC